MKNRQKLVQIDPLRLKEALKRMGARDQSARRQTVYKSFRLEGPKLAFPKLVVRRPWYVGVQTAPVKRKIHKEVSRCFTTEPTTEWFDGIDWPFAPQQDRLRFRTQLTSLAKSGCRPFTGE